jgi:putative transposase
MCRLLGVSKSGFYAWRDRPLSARARCDVGLSTKIHAIHQRSKGAYGAPMIQAELADDHDIHVGCKRVARLMRAACLKGATHRRFVHTTVSDEHLVAVPDRLKRQFVAGGPNQTWVADITYIPTWSGFLYLAIVLDVWSRKIVGWAMHSQLHTKLVLDALQMAYDQRRPANVIHHSDRGCQYTSFAFSERCREMNVVPSMGTVGDAYDNAMAESFFATLDRELQHRRFKSQQDARLAIFEWIEGWYNSHRRHSALGRISPNNFERRHATLQTARRRLLPVH